MTSRKGVPRVVWERKRADSDSQVDMLPFLSVSRSLGDFWSYNSRTQKFVVSPTPDIKVLPLNPKVQKFVIIASDGLWNVMTPQEVIEFVWDYEHDESTLHQPKDVVRAIINEGLRRWERKNLLADNIAVLIAFLREGNQANVSASSASVNEAASSSSCSSSAEVASTSTPEAGAETEPIVDPVPSPSTVTAIDRRSTDGCVEQTETPPPSTATAEAAPTPSAETGVSTEPREEPPPSTPQATEAPHSSEVDLSQSTSFQCTSSQITSQVTSSEAGSDNVVMECYTTRKLRFHRKGKRSSRKRSSSKVQKADSEGNGQSSPKRRNEVVEDELPAKRTKIDPDSGCDSCDHNDMECDSQAEKLVSPDQPASVSSSGVFSEGMSEPAAAPLWYVVTRLCCQVLGGI